MMNEKKHMNSYKNKYEKNFDNVKLIDNVLHLLKIDKE